MSSLNRFSASLVRNAEFGNLHGRPADVSLVNFC